MRLSHIIIIALAVAGCVLCYSIGYREGTNQSDSKKDLQGRIAITLHTYQAAESTNWAKVRSALGVQLLAITKSYERRFGIETGSNRFAQVFAAAKTVADRVEGQMVPIGSILTNFPTVLGSKVTATEEK